LDCPFNRMTLYLASREPRPRGVGQARERLCRTGELSGLLVILSDISCIPEYK
jgi:hypothetical protein